MLVEHGHGQTFRGGREGRISTRLGRLRRMPHQVDRPARHRRAAAPRRLLSRAPPPNVGIDRSRQHDATRMPSCRTSCISASVNALTRGLGGAVGRAAGERVRGRQAADVDDPAAAAGPQVRQRRARGVEDAGDVGVEQSRHSSSVISATGWNRPTPALLTTIRGRRSGDGRVARGRPCRRATQRRRAARARGRPPRARDRCTAAAACRRTVPVMATAAPRDASARAVASPMPREPPVTSATFPEAADTSRSLQYFTIHDLGCDHRRGRALAARWHRRWPPGTACAAF